jgi:hypothetical protein
MTGLVNEPVTELVLTDDNEQSERWQRYSATIRVSRQL